MTSKFSFKFSNQQKISILSQADSVTSFTGVQLAAQIGESDNSEFLTLSLSQPNSEPMPDLQLFTIISLGISEYNNEVHFSGKSGDGRLLGPSAVYNSFDEVLAYGMAFARRTCTVIAQRQSEPSEQRHSLTKATPNSRPNTNIEALNCEFSLDDLTELDNLKDSLAQLNIKSYVETIKRVKSSCSAIIGILNPDCDRVPVVSITKSHTGSEISVSFHDPLNGDQLRNSVKFSSIKQAIYTYSDDIKTLFKNKDTSTLISATNTTLRSDSIPKPSSSGGIRIASFLGIVLMYIAFGMICSLLGFTAYFLSRSKIGTKQAVFLAIAVAMLAKLLAVSTFN